MVRVLLIGLVWCGHTQGSGKSLTMVFTARMVRAARELEDFKIIMMNDRVDLEEQLTRTARLIGGKVNVIETRDGVLDQLGAGTSDINMVMPCLLFFASRRLETSGTLLEEG
jgi:type I restriction enzyme, R subunit